MKSPDLTQIGAMQSNMDCTSSIRTIPSVREFHPIGLQSKFADYTAGEEFHLAPKR